MAEVKKKIRPGLIQLHDSEAALLVHYEVQEVTTGADGSQELLSSSQATKKITVKSLSERTDLQALAAEIVDRCKLIHPSKTGLVQGLLQQLQRRELGLGPDAARTAHAGAAAAASGAGTGSRPSTSSSGGSNRTQRQQQEQQQAGADAAQAAARSAAKPPAHAAASALAAAAAGGGSNRPASAQPQSASRPHTASNGSSRVGTPQKLRHMPPPPQQPQYRLLQASEAFQAYAQALTRSSRPAFLDDAEVHIEGMYDEELPQRAAAADMLCQLFRNSANMQALLSRETLLSTLARLLREDGPRSLDMATAVAGCFYACSCVKELHRQLLDNQVGSLLMDLVALEQQRTAAREAQEGPGSSAGALVAKAAATATAGRAGGRHQQQPQQVLEQREFRLLSLVVSQDRFLFIALAALLNLAEEPAVQRKMVKKGVAGLLLGLLGRPHLEVLLLVVSFLRRLCVFAEGKARVSAAPGVVPQLVALLQPGCGEQLQCAVLRLLHNLSFDGTLRQQMMCAGLVQQAVPLLDGSRTAPLAAGLLYQLSMNDEARAAFCFCPGALGRLLDSILRALRPSNAGPGGASSSPGGLRTIPELIALAVNVAHSSGVAEWFNEGERLHRVLQRALATADELAWKLLRNLAVSGGALLAPCLLSHADGMLGLLQLQDTGPELFVEVLGVLAVAADAACGDSRDSSSNSAEAASGEAGSSGVAPWQLMPGVALQELLAFLVACFQPGALEDDALLEAVVLLGALAGWPEGDRELADSGLLPRLVELLPDKRSDDEFVLQACWAFRRALMQPASTHALLAHNQVVMYLVDLLQDPCMAVSRVAGSCLDVVIDSSDDMAGAIRSLKFEAFNQEWLKLAGPEAHQLMAAAAAWQQQQLQAYIQQLHSHHHQQQQEQDGIDPAATPFNTFVRGGAQQQQQQRRDAMNGYGFCADEEQQQAQAGAQQYGQGLEQYDFGGGKQAMGQFDGAVHGPPLTYGCFGEAGDEDAHFKQQLQQQQEQEQQQLQWVSSPAVAGGGQQETEGGCMGRSSSMGARDSMVTAAGQCILLDFDAFVAESQQTPSPAGV